MKKLDIRGVAHDVLLVGFLVVFAIGGVAYVVASRAATCEAAVSSSASSAVSLVSSPVSNECAPVSLATSAPASTPVPNPPTTTPTPTPPTTTPTPKPPTTTPAPNPPTTPAVYSATCNIFGVPANPKNKTTVRPYVMIKNTGNKSSLLGYKVKISKIDSNGKTSAFNTQNYVGTRVGPGLSFKGAMPTYKVGTKSSAMNRISFTVTNNKSNAKFSCTSTLTLPKK